MNARMCGTITAVFLLLFSTLNAQNLRNLPIHPYTNPDEVVTFSRETNFDQAIEILNSFSKQYEQRIIINKTSMHSPIGVNIPPMPWKQALNYIIAATGMVLNEYPNYYEILPKGSEKKESKVEQGLVDLHTREIKISATFFEGNKRLLREIGVDWSTLKNGKVQLNTYGESSVTQEFFTVRFPNEPLPWTSILSSGWNVKALFSTFEAANEGKIIASPTVKVMDGEEGYIQVGQDFSIKQTDFAGNTVDKFFSTGTILKVTPNIIDIHDTTFIHMEVSAEKSSAQPDPVSTVINKQQATTQVLMLSGEETVIGGLYRTDETSVRKGIPFLKDLPWWVFGIRYLFGYESKDTSEQELVILIKAEIVPTISERLAKMASTKADTVTTDSSSFMGN